MDAMTELAQVVAQDIGGADVRLGGPVDRTGRWSW